MDLQMLRHKWFPTDDGRDVCSLCAQPDFPEVGIFCPGPKPVIEPIPPGPYVEPRFDPKPATPQPPEWKGVGAPAIGETFLLDGRPYVVTGVVQSEPGTPEKIIDRVTDAISDFIARRKAKRALANLSAEASEEVAEEGRQDGRSAEPLSRAMSTPLPHDPPMSARLMPWRGKE